MTQAIADVFLLLTVLFIGIVLLLPLIAQTVRCRSWQRLIVLKLR